MTTEFWIEKGWGESIDNATVEDVNFAIEEIIRIEDEYGTFWVGHTEKEYVLKIHKNLDLFFIYGKNQDKQMQIKLGNWDEFVHFFERYYAKDFVGLKKEIKLILLSNSRLDMETKLED